MSLPIIEMKQPELSKQPFEDQQIETILADNTDELESEEESIEVEEKESEDPFEAPKLVKAEQEVVQEISQEAEDDQLGKEIGQEPKKGKRAYVRKKPMSQKQIDHLAKIRAIGVEKRKQRAAEKREQKLLDQENEAEERLLKKKQKKEDDELLKKAKEEKAKLTETPKPIPAPLNKQVPIAYSQEDLENAMLRAVETYDTQRKVRKVAKKKKQAQEDNEAKKIKIIQNAINPNLVQAPANDPWRQLFG